MAKKAKKTIGPADTGITLEGVFAFTPYKEAEENPRPVSIYMDGKWVAMASAEEPTVEFNTADFENGVHEIKVMNDNNRTTLLELFFHNKKAAQPTPEELRSLWEKTLGAPRESSYNHSVALIKQFDGDGFTAKLLRQNNGPTTWQRVLIMYPKGATAPCPAVVAPFYNPNKMSRLNLETGEELLHENAETIGYGRDLVARGFVTIMSETYHLTYIQRPKNDKDLNDFTRWRRAAAKLNEEEPGWTGVGKLVADTRLLIDLLETDPMVDASRIGIIGHSLGGKISFYTGCLDERVKAIVSSDFGIGWEQTNWSDPWYWGKKFAFLRASSMDHSQLLAIAAPKPFLLIAGNYDNDGANAFFAAARPYYDAHGAFDNLKLFNHATGHRPTPEATEQSYKFLEEHLM
ncbi:MAG: dienelactone hydrolase family protein [Victivallales bacterium]|nr:dienelactone hydrolase family protein [Victivallales bacterium]